MGLKVSKVFTVQAALFIVSSSVGEAACPLTGSVGTLPEGHLINGPTESSQAHAREYAVALKDLDIDAVKADLVKLMHDSQDFWPADFGHYGPLFIRLAWHCAGSYRASDGLGGCDGGRLRFDPELSWDDNTNLDKANKLLLPIKEKYGLGLSWGDLIVLAGTTAIEDMGGPVLGFCAGRIDDLDGSASINLGPTPEQENNFPCDVNGQCDSPFGTTTIGLIYVNPEGPMGNPIPEDSAPQVRDTFGRMSMDDAETVALIGGGHAFGKTHGACPAGPGPKPNQDPTNPWPGMCGTGKGADTFTSGFEGAWTSTPTAWGNLFFHRLLYNEWVKYMGPGGHWQWRGKYESETSGTMMLTSDVSLLHDPPYKQLVELYAHNATALDDAFSHAWYKMASRDMGPASRCVGKFVPPAQPFQYPLPATPEHLADINAVKAEVERVVQAQTSNGAALTRLALQCASSFRQTDYLGGCNGARIRFTPQSTWDINTGLDQTLQLLQPIKLQFGPTLSWSDLIVLAGQSALELGGGHKMRFCAGRTDATDGSGADLLSPNPGADVSATELKSNAALMGMTSRAVVVLRGMPRSGEQQALLGYEGTWSTDPSVVDNTYFTTLLNNSWEKYTLASGKTQFRVKGGEKGGPVMTLADIALTHDEELVALVKEYAADNQLFLKDFAGAWADLMNVDRFDGPVGNLCPAGATTHLVEDPENTCLAQY